MSPDDSAEWKEVGGQIKPEMVSYQSNFGTKYYKTIQPKEEIETINEARLRKNNVTNRQLG